MVSRFGVKLVYKRNVESRWMAKFVYNYMGGERVEWGMESSYPSDDDAVNDDIQVKLKFGKLW